MGNVCNNDKSCYLSAFDSMFYSKLRDNNDIKQISITRSKKVSNDRYIREIEIFTDILKTNIKPELLKRFNNNINTLRIKKKRTRFRQSDTIATYNSHTNEINLFDEDSIYHELFHMSSSILTSASNDLFVANDFVGLKDEFKGKGLNEGYTQLLTERYFNDKPSYVRLVDIVKILEFMIGEDKMHSFYFETGLKGLTDELKNYLFDEDLMLISRLIQLTDELCIFHCKNDNNDYRIERVYEALFKIYYRILLQKVNNKELTAEEALNNYDSLKLKLFSLYSNDNDLSVRPDEIKDYNDFIKKITVDTDRIRWSLKYNLGLYKKTR